eukprot:evm.model.scf_1450.3 EVM.evm.TU.scf_1450.3   scf_1450:26714-35429(-)
MVLLEMISSMPSLSHNLRTAHETLAPIVQSLRRMRHQNVRNILDWFWAGDRIVACYEWEGGAWLDEVVRVYGPLDERLARKFISQVAQGLKCLHTLGHYVSVGRFNVTVASGQAKIAVSALDLLPREGGRAVSEASLRHLALGLLRGQKSSDAAELCKLCEDGAGLEEICAFLNRGRWGCKRGGWARVSGLEQMFKKPRLAVGSEPLSQAESLGVSVAPIRQTGLHGSEHHVQACLVGHADDASASSKPSTPPAQPAPALPRNVSDEEHRMGPGETCGACEDLSRGGSAHTNSIAQALDRFSEDPRQASRQNDCLRGEPELCSEATPGVNAVTGKEVEVQLEAEEMSDVMGTVNHAHHEPPYTSMVIDLCSLDSDSGTDGDGREDCLGAVGCAPACSADQQCTSVAVTPGSTAAPIPCAPVRSGTLVKGKAKCFEEDGAGCACRQGFSGYELTTCGRPKRKASQVGSDFLIAMQLDEKLNREKKGGNSSHRRHRQPGAEAQCIYELTSEQRMLMQQGAIRLERNVYIQPDTAEAGLDFEYSALLVASPKATQNGIKRGSCRSVLREGCSYEVWAGMLPGKGKGWGVIAMEPIPRGHCIFEYAGELQTEEEMQHCASERHHTKYVFDVDARTSQKDFRSLSSSDRGQLTCIDAQRKGNISRFVNHSCDPCMEVRKMTRRTARVFKSEGGVPRILFQSLCDIVPGQELTVDYFPDLSREQLERCEHKTPCLCGSDKCKGWVVTMDLGDRGARDGEASEGGTSDGESQ